MNPIFNIFNYDYIQQQSQKQYEQQQINQVLETVHKLQDCLDSADKVAPEYKELLSNACCGVLFDYLKKHNVF